MNKLLLIFTYVMLALAILLALLMLVCLAVVIFSTQIVPPIIIYAIMSIVAVLFVLHYNRCIKVLKDDSSITIKQLNRLQTANILLIFFSFGPISLVTIAQILWLPLYFGNHIFDDNTMLVVYICLICAFIISTMFNTNLTLISKLCENIAKKRKQG